MEQIHMETVRKVYMIHKTHLDIGFTGFAQEVLDCYVEEFIPRAITTAEHCNKDGKKNFIWTVGSYLIHYYMEHADAAGRERLTQAILRGDIVWHALPCTTETEVMDGELFRFGLEMGRRLEKQFGLPPHIAAKMTDVPSHTAAILPALAEYGVQYLHIGINGSSRPVDVPELCRWKYGDSEVILNYAGYYGRPCVFEDIALEFAHTSDNMGPPTEETVWVEMERLAAIYPNAEIVSASLDDFAADLLTRKERLPVFEWECGDTWIHNASSDPWKAGMLRELLALGAQWRNEDPAAAENTDYRVFMEDLLLTSEHTCGMDVKKYLYDFRNWDKADFQMARARDVIPPEDMEPAGERICKFLTEEELPQYTGGQFLGSYSHVEHSWEEQRDYLRHAMEKLPALLRARAGEAAEDLRPEQPTEFGTACEPHGIHLGIYTADVEPDGSLRLKTADGGESTLGILRYDTYSAKTVEDCYFSYNRCFKTTQHWAEPDFSKPGIRYSKTAKDQSSPFRLTGVRRDGDRLLIDLEALPEQANLYACPRRAQIEYTVSGDKIYIRLSWFDKDANRLPEALFFGFCFDRNENLRLYKLDQPIDPYQVAEGGNRKFHACQKIESSAYELLGVHSPLVSVGGRHLYDVDEEYGDIRDGLHFILYNNRWNTNCPVYYSQNAAFEFTLIFRQEVAHETL